MKYIFLFLLPGILGASCQNAASDNDALKKNIVNIIKAFNDKDAAALNKMIHKDHGLTVVFRSGVFDQYQTTDKIDFNNPVPRNWSYPDVKPESDIRYETLPTFDCGTEKWSKQGLYCNIDKRDDLLSKTAYNLKTYAEIDIAPGIIEKFKDLESKSHRVVLIDDKGESLIFYLSLIKNKWYITALDRVSGDCSA